MQTRKHVHEEIFDATPEQVFVLLHTPSAIRTWWQASGAIVLPEAGGIWCATWGGTEDDPEYIASATIAVFEPPERMVFSDYRYYAKSGALPFESDFSVEFLVAPHSEGTALRVTQDGFPASPEGDAFMDACRTGWTNTFAGIRRFLGIE